MATASYGLAETYVMTKLYKEKMKKQAQEEKERNTHIKVHAITTDSEDKTSSGCFSFLSKQHHRKISRISDYNDTEVAKS
ncbi:uncharacterized protein LOC113848277 [Abrus precatorius]|uniref:Uncharacterized protein LOC113848277 n=1 Tax=Abrus precatorius TaxID=3816 RepID=A0A8B8JPZ8_ABRPR|nr:uncharacterized protein LOC113848277 [Abrus precatorius]